MTNTPHVLLLTDFSPAARSAYEGCARLAQRLGAHVELLHVVPDDLPVAASTMQAKASVAQAYATLEERIDAARRQIEVERDRLPKALDVDTEVLVEGKLDKAITEHASSTDADYIVLATHGRSGVSRLLMGSVADSVLRSSPKPVIVFPAHEED